MAGKVIRLLVLLIFSACLLVPAISSAGSFFAGGTGPALQMGAEKAAVTWSKNLESQTALFRQLINSLGISAQKNENLRVFGPNSSVYRPFSDDMQIRSGLRGINHLSSYIRDDLYSYLRKFNSKKDIQNRLRNTSAGKGVFRSGDTMAPKELAGIKEMNKTILDPYPTRNLKIEGDRNRIFSDYKSLRKVKESKLLIPAAVLSDLTASRAPLIKGGKWFSETCSTDKAVNGKTSVNGLTAILTDMRFANQGWYAGRKGVHGKTETGVLREILQMKVDRLMTEYRKMIWLDRMAALLAQKQLSQNERFNRMLDKIRTNALKQ